MPAPKQTTLDDIAAEMNRIGQDNSETLTAIDARLGEVEQLITRRPGGGGGGGSPSLGRTVVNGNEDKLKAVGEQRGRVSIAVKNIITSAPDSGGAAVEPERDRLVSMPMRKFAVRDLLPLIRVSTDAVVYARQTARQINAAVVPEGDLKPESTLAYELVTANIKTIAHWLVASKQILDDWTQLQGTIDIELKYGLRIIEDAELLYGAGGTSNILGMVTVAAAFAPPIEVPDPNMIDVLGLALLQCSLAGFPPDGIVLNDADWMKIRLIKNSDGEYILGPPGADVEPRLFGLPVSVTPGQDSGTFLVGAFAIAATFYDRWAARVEVSTEDGDNFRRNLVTILGEERIGLGIKQEEALVTGDFESAMAAAAG